MKRILYIVILLSGLLLMSCYRCVECEIYDEEGYYVKNYGEYCGDIITTSSYEIDADDHAYKYYGGWAECYSY